MKYLMWLCFLSFASISWAQDSRYELKGNFGQNLTTKKPITFALTWSEAEGLAKGNYQDDYYGRTDQVKGIAGDLGRIFIVTFPKETKGVRSISFLSSQEKGKKDSVKIPISVITRDKDGTPITTIAANAVLTRAPVLVAQRQEEGVCKEGFGLLAGYCGVYEGMVVKERDNSKRCQLTEDNILRLVLDQDGTVMIFLGETSEIIEVPGHRVGRLPVDIGTTFVDLLSRECRPLPGTTFPGDNCKRLNLRGDFSTRGQTKHFLGTYTIIDEATNQKCEYTLSMDSQT